MSVRLSARKLAVGYGGGIRPILTRAGIDRAVRKLERRYGHDLSGLKADEMALHELNIVGEEIIRIAQARYTFGLKPFSPIKPGEIFVVEGVPVPYLSDDEVVALLAIVQAVARDEGWPHGNDEQNTGGHP